ncbi:hypothetical protein LNO81_09885 [Klebsiella variicola subsp. variicola]|nr:hypothetical protein [Klebsiella variicola subsp. variicola]
MVAAIPISRLTTSSEGELAGKAAQEQQDRQHCALQQDQPAAIVTVAEREQEENAERVASLRQGRNQPHPFYRQMEIGAHQRQ